MPHCIGVCACLNPAVLEDMGHFTVWSLSGGPITVNMSTTSCALAHELPSNVDWGNRTGKDLARVLLTTYLAPPVILITMLTNITICIVLTRRHMISPTNIILLSMALVDMLTGLFPLPMYLITEFAHDWTLANICTSPLAVNLVMLTCNILPTIFHTASIWLTVILAIQRWIYINFPMSVRRLCTNRASVKATVVLLVIITAFMCAWFYLDGPYKAAVALPNGDNATQPPPYLVVSCTEQSEKSIFKAMVYTRTLLANVVPSVLLIVFTALLIKGIGQAARRRKNLGVVNANLTSATGGPTTSRAASAAKRKASLTRQASARRTTDDAGSNTTVMLTIVVGLFMVVELPMTVVMALYLLSIDGFVSSIGEVMGYAMPVINFLILVTYPVNFFIYSMMSTQFRDTFASIFLGCCGDTATATATATATDRQAIEPSVRRKRSEAFLESLEMKPTKRTARGGGGGGGGGGFNGRSEEPAEQAKALIIC